MDLLEMLRKSTVFWSRMGFAYDPPIYDENGDIMLISKETEKYAKYHDQGFEIYQVGIDTSKALWINTIQEQQLPWISVSDLRGEASPAVGAYNVQSLPANFLIDREGNIVGKDVYGADLDKRVAALL